VLRGLYVRGGSAGGSVLALCCRSSAYGDWRGRAGSPSSWLPVPWFSSSAWCCEAAWLSFPDCWWWDRLRPARRRL